MPLHSATRVLPKETDTRELDWQISEPLLEADGAPAPLSRASSEPGADDARLNGAGAPSASSNGSEICQSSSLVSVSFGNTLVALCSGMTFLPPTDRHVRLDHFLSHWRSRQRRCRLRFALRIRYPLQDAVAQPLNVAHLVIGGETDPNSCLPLSDRRKEGHRGIKA